MEGNYSRGIWLGGSVIGYILYMEFSPRMGNIIWRNGRLCLLGGLKCMLYPLQEPRMWLPEMWSANFFMWIGGGALVGYMTDLFDFNV